VGTFKRPVLPSGCIGSYAPAWEQVPMLRYHRYLAAGVAKVAFREKHHESKNLYPAVMGRRLAARGHGESGGGQGSDPRL